MSIKKQVLSGIRPTGMLHLGNYLGAVKQFVKLQAEGHKCFFFVADLHSLTTHNASSDIKQKSINVAKGFLACGIDPSKSVLYKQSTIPKIPYLANILSMLTSESWLRKCTTYKEKKGQQEQPSLGLLSYPVLMTADIIIMDADLVPVGHDQLQHLEMARDITNKFNNLYGQVFKIPEAIKLKAIRVPGLDGKGKMGKSNKNFIGLFEDPKTINSKILSAVTDSGPSTDEFSPPMKNLYHLLKLCCPPEIYDKYLDLHKQKNQKYYGQLKKDLAKHIINMLSPMREKYNSLSDNDVIEFLEAGSKTAQQKAEEMFDKAFSKLNL